MKDNSGRARTKAVITGWTSANGTVSDILSLWGFIELGKTNSDVYALALSTSALTAARQKNGLG